MSCTSTAITTPINGDGCCPTGANANTDNDCLPICGNSVQELGETCDTGISTGTGLCPTLCSDTDVCTTEALVSAGTCQAACMFTTITTAANDDGCCPLGANASTDNDCQCNDGGTLRDASPPLPGDLIIAEVMPNPGAVSDTDGEWFEIFAINAFDLNGVGLDRAGDTSNPNVITSADCIHLTAGSYAVFAKNADSGLNGGVPAASIRATFTFALVDGTMVAPGDVRLMDGTNVIDAITWTSTRSGRSHALDPDIVDATGNDQESNFCDGTTVFGGGDQGTPGMLNAQCNGAMTGMCNVAGAPRPIVKPTAGQLVITEFLANPAGTVAGVDAAQEWFEITNTGAAAFDLNDLGLKGSAATVNLIVSADCKSVTPGGFAVFAHGTDPQVNGGLPLPDATFTFALGNTSGSLSVLDGATPLDVVTWTAGITDGATDQLQPANTNVTDNDAPANFCKAKTPQTYGATANVGTPKALNVCLP